MSSRKSNTEHRKTGPFGWLGRMTGIPTLGLHRDGSIDGWFWRRLNIYSTEAACFTIIAYLTVNHVASVHSFLGHLVGSLDSQPASQTDSTVTENLIWWAFALWGTCVVAHIFGPSAENLIESLATAIAAKFGVALPANTKTTVVATTETSAAPPGRPGGKNA